MRVGIVGGGPAGLYLALLMKKQNPAHEIRVVEQNPAGATYGWGVVFSDRALSYLAASDPDSYRHIARRLQTWDDQAIVHKGQQVRIDGLGFSGIARLELLHILQEHCRHLGVEVQFDTRLTDLTPLHDCDLIVGADGVNSVVRETYRAQFQPSVEVLSNKYVWYGTPQWFDCLTLTFRGYRKFKALLPLRRQYHAPRDELTGSEGTRQRSRPGTPRGREPGASRRRQRVIRTLTDGSPELLSGLPYMRRG